MDAALLDFLAPRSIPPTSSAMDGTAVERSSSGRRSRREQRDRSVDIAWSDVGRFAEAIMRAQRELLSAARGIREEFALGPRGTWILGLIATGRIRTQADVVKRYDLGRSIIAEEMARLTQAGLVQSERDGGDRRQVALRLTRAGEQANARMGEAMAAHMAERMEGYTLGDLLFCTGLLEDMARPAPGQDEDASRPGRSVNI